VALGNYGHRKKAAQAGNRPVTRIKENPLPRIKIGVVGGVKCYKIYKFSTYGGGEWKLWDIVPIKKKEGSTKG